MKERILTGWTFTRALYLAIGVFLIVQSIMDRQWFGVAFGGYFAAMGLFAFGCASGNCFGRSCTTEPVQSSKNNLPEVEYEEVKAGVPPLP